MPYLFPLPLKVLKDDELPAHLIQGGVGVAAVEVKDEAREHVDVGLDRSLKAPEGCMYAWAGEVTS